MHLKTCFFLPLLLSLSLTTQAQPSSDSTPRAQSSALDSALFYQLLLGELNARGDDPATGYALMLDGARKTNDPNLFRRAVHMALQVRSGETALLAAKAWSQAQPGSREANQYILQVLLGLNRIPETLEPLKRDLQLSAANEKQDTLWAIPTLFKRVSDHALASATVKKTLASYLQDHNLGPTAWAVVGRMALRAGDAPAALAAAINGIKLNPRSEHAALLALSLMEPEQATAEQLVQQHIPHARPEFRMAYIKALLNAKREADAKVQLQAIRQQTPDYPDTWLIEGALAMQEGHIEAARSQLQHYLELTERATKTASTDYQRGRTQALFSLAQLDEQQKDFKQADAWLLRVDNADDLLRAQIRRAGLMARQGQLEQALALIESQPDQTASDARLKRSAQVQLLKEHQQFKRARSLLQASLADHPDDPDMAYDLAMVHEKLGELDDMERLLRQLIAARPNDPQAYNALGYALADRHLRLPEAKALINQAVALAPNDAYISDSLAWVEFRLGNLETALQLLQAAYQHKPDVEIAAHLGEVLWSLKRPAEALQIWREAFKLNPDNENLNQTLKRLQVKL